ncbi:MAG TPA: M24 family metallopeptidase [Pyrinomonadaceae bacterium]|nr:M24 family metallopeptidase [Pyrinomonadaceae bacterium]
MNKRDEINAKVDRLVEMLAAKNLGGALIGSQPNFSWLSAGGSNGIDLSRETGAGALFVRNDGKRFVLANRIEIQRLLDEELIETDFEPVEFGWEEEKASAAFFGLRTRRLLDDNSAIGSDIYSGPGVVPLESELARCRYQLTESEIERLRALGSDASEAIVKLAHELQPGEPEQQVARRVADGLAVHNIRSIVTLVAADDRISKYRHPVPTSQRWQHAVMIVVGAQRGGLITSFTRIVHHGTIPDDLRRRTEAAAQVNAQLLAATKPGASGADLFKLAAQTYASEGFANEERLHHQGGATGYRTRDWVAHPASNERVQLHQAFAWNPSVTGTKVEETCIAFADGVEVITGNAGWPQVSTRVDGREYLSPDILQL